MSLLRVALWAGKRREQGFGCGRRKSPTARGGIGFDIGSRGRLKRRRPRSHCGCAGKFVHRLLLEALGLELDRLDPGAKEFGGCAVNERGRRFQRAPHGAQRYDRHFPPWRNATFDLSDLACRQRPLSPRMPEQKQEQAGVDVNLLLFLLWHARRKRTLSASEIAELERRIAPWREMTVIPLRTMRPAREYPPTLADGG